MSVNYTYDAEKNILFVFPEGILQVEDIIGHTHNVRGDKEIRKGFIELVHFSSLEDMKISYAESMRILPEFKMLIREKGYVGSVLLAGNDFQYGMANMFSMVAQGVADFRPVRSEEAAYEAIAAMREG